MSGTLRKILSRKMLTLTLLSITSGVPLGIALSLVQVWITEAGFDMKTVGLVSLVQLPYTFKFLWAPLMDRYQPFGQRRQGWMIITQAGIILAVGLLGFFDPKSNMTMLMAFSVLVSFFGASHDIVIDAYRREVLKDDEIGFGSAVASNAYLISYRFLIGILGLTISSMTSWQNTFLFFAAVCVVGVIGTIIAPQVVVKIAPPKNIRDAVVLPFLNYLKRPGAFEILIFILLYKVGDNFAANLLTPFYLKIGFTKPEIAWVGKLVGFWAMFIGTFIGGFFLFRFSVRKCLLWFGVLQGVSTVGFSVLNELITSDHINKLVALSCAIGFENLTSGMGTAAYSAFLLQLVDRRFSATQYALLTSLMGVPRVVIPGFAGFVSEPLGWTNFFVFGAFLAVPGILLVFFRGKKWEESLPS